MHLGPRSESSRSFRKTIPVESLGASGCVNPCTADARSSFHLHNNLGKKRAACSGRRSHKSLQRASFAQRREGSFPAIIGIAPTQREQESLFERPLLGHFALGEQAGQLHRKVPPSPQLMQLDLVQLRAEVAHLKEIVLELARQSFGKHKADNTKSFNKELGAEGAHNTNQNNNNNNNNDNNSTNNNNKDSRESSFNSLDLDKDNPEKELSSSDLDESSLGSFTPEGSVESSFSSQDQQEAACSLDKRHLGALGHQMMTIGFSLGSLNQRNQKRSKDRDSFDKKKQKKKVSFSEATLEAYKARSHNDRQQNSQLRQLEYNSEYQNNNQQAWQN